MLSYKLLWFQEDPPSGYPQLSSEYIVDSDPSLIVLADSECCDQTPEVVASRITSSGIRPEAMTFSAVPKATAARMGITRRKTCGR